MFPSSISDANCQSLDEFAGTELGRGRDDLYLRYVRTI